jgi:hypothetical protein
MTHARKSFQNAVLYYVTLDGDIRALLPPTTSKFDNKETGAELGYFDVMHTQCFLTFCVIAMEIALFPWYALIFSTAYYFSVFRLTL